MSRPPGIAQRHSCSALLLDRLNPDCVQRGHTLNQFHSILSYSHHTLSPWNLLFPHCVLLLVYFPFDESLSCLSFESSQRRAINWSRTGQHNWTSSHPTESLNLFSSHIILSPSQCRFTFCLSSYCISRSSASRALGPQRPKSTQRTRSQRARTRKRSRTGARARA